MYLDANDNKIKLQPEEGDLEYLIDAYIKLEGVISDNEGDRYLVKEEICEHVCLNLLCTDIGCSECPFHFPDILTLKTLELIIQEEFKILN